MAMNFFAQQERARSHTKRMLALFVLAVVKAPSSGRSNNIRCLQQVSNEEHVSLEAFFQNPMEQDAMVQAMEVCAR